jgi:hypothetical protein
MALEKVITEDKIEIVGELQSSTSTNLHQSPRRRRRAIRWLSQARYHWLVRTTVANQQRYRRFVQRFTRLKLSQPLKHHKKETHHNGNI